MFGSSHTTRGVSRPPAAVTSARPAKRRRRISVVTNGHAPEWMTERWKHRVEAEAGLT
jgi:hypothetical protein